MVAPVSITDDIRPKGLASGAPDDDDPNARVHQEIALWSSPRMQKVREVIGRAADIDVTVLITGETATGKELVARAVHSLGARRAGPFVKVNFAAVAREPLENELFGHERGAFTGARRLKIGKFQAADHGTIFLDEIGDLHTRPAGQAPSRPRGRPVFSSGRPIHRQGGRAGPDGDQPGSRASSRGQPVSRRPLLPAQRHSGHGSPLRERPEEIPVMAGYFVDRYSRLFRRAGFTLAPETIDRLVRYSFPGNIRELENMIKRMIVLGDPLLAWSPLLEVTASRKDSTARHATHPVTVCLKDISRKAAHAAERTAILQALDHTHWNCLQAAKLLNISYRALLYKIKDARLDRNRNGSDRP